MSISKRISAFLLAMIMAVGVFSFTAAPTSAITDAEFVAPDVTIPDSIPQPDNDLLTNNVNFLLGEGTRYEIKMTSEFIPAGQNNRPGNINYQKYIVVHNTGNYGATATAWANHNYGRTTTNDVSWHYTCGNDGIYQLVPVNERAWHAGGNYWTSSNSGDRVSDGSNSTGIGIETATPGFPATGTSNGGKWNTEEMYEWYETVYDSTATYLGMLVGWLCVSLNFNPYTQIIQHYNTAGKNCPEQMRYVFGTNATFAINGTYYKVFKDRMYDYYKAFGGTYTSADTGIKNQYYNPNKTVYKKGLYKSSSAVTVYRAGNTSTGSVGTVAANQVMDIQTIGFDWGRVVLSNGTAGWVKLSGLTYVGNTYRLGTYRTSSGSIVNVTNISGTTAYYDGGSTAISNLTKVYKVTVKGDTAFGSTPKYYAKGEKFTITAAAPTGTSEFDMWELTTGACTFASKTASTTTVTVKDSDLVISATYRGDYILTVTDGLGGGRYKGGTSVKISAAGKAGYEFAGWELVSGTGTIADPSAFNTTFTMGTSDATVKATYRVAGALDTTGLTNYALGKSYTSTWKGSSSITYYSTTQADTNRTKLTDGTKATAAYSTAHGCYTSFTTSGSTGVFTINLGTSRNIRMIALCDIANNGGSFGDVQQGSIKVEYSTNGTSFTPISVVDTLLYSYSGGVQLSNVYTHRLDFSPVNATHVRVSFTSSTYCTSISEIEVYGGENTAKLTVENGTGSGTYNIGTSASIKGTSPGADYEFTGWTLVSGNGSFANASSESTTFSVAVGGATVKANYKKIEKLELNAGVTATIENGYLSGVAAGKTGAELKAMFKYDVTVTDANGVAVTDASFVGTGFTITAGEEKVEIVIVGDLNSDASVSTTDFIVLKRFLSGKVNLAGAFEKASDCDESGAVSSSDYIALAASLKG